VTKIRPKRRPGRYLATGLAGFSSWSAFPGSRPGCARSFRPPSSFPVGGWSDPNHVGSRAETTAITTGGDLNHGLRHPQPCIGVKDASCVEVCPVDCIHTDEAADMYYIDPDECIDCGACVDPCPVDAIYPEDEVPAVWTPFIQINADYFQKVRS
jgi:ferredoxin